jgi:hypothetical protein
MTILIIGLSFLLCLAITSRDAPTAKNWEIDSNDTVGYMLLGSNDTLYTFCGNNGNNITAIRSDGTIAWTLAVPRQWMVLDNLILAAYEDVFRAEWVSMPVVDEHEGYLYLYLRPSGETNPAEGYESIYYDNMLMAIASNGTIAWTRVVSQNDENIYAFQLQTISGNMKYVVSVKASGDRIYLFHGYKEDVFDRDGRLLFTLPSVSAPVAVDAGGRIYAVRLAAVPAETLQAMLNNSTLIGWNRYATSYKSWEGTWTINSDPDAHVLPSGIVEAYAPDGTPLWHRDLGEGALWQPLSATTWQSYNTLPLHMNDTIYVPLYDGVAALDTEGRLRWVSHIEDGPYRLFERMPIDQQGNVYMQKTENDKNSTICLIDNNGSRSAKAWNITNSPTAENYQPYPAPLAGREGIVYVTPAYPPITIADFNETISTLRYDLDTIEAIDLTNGLILWNFTVPAADKRVVTLDRDNAGNTNSDMYEYLSETVPGWAEQIKHRWCL